MGRGCIHCRGKRASAGKSHLVLGDEFAPLLTVALGEDSDITKLMKYVDNISRTRRMELEDAGVLEKVKSMQHEMSTFLDALEKLSGNIIEEVNEAISTDEHMRIMLTEKDRDAGRTSIELMQKPMRNEREREKELQALLARQEKETNALREQLARLRSDR